MPVFERSTRVAAAPEELFRFHGNPGNLRAVSPPGLRILGIEAEEEPRVGEEFRIALGKGPIVLRWTGRWTEVAPPGLLVDDGVQTPFALWRHAHRFDPAPEGGSILTDRVEFRLRWTFGGPLGDWFAGRFLFPAMFAGRHAATRAWFDRHRVR